MPRAQGLPRPSPPVPDRAGLASPARPAYRRSDATDAPQRMRTGTPRMIRFLFRFVGLWVLAGAFVALVLDGVRSIASAEIVTTPLGVTWLAVGPDSLTRFQAFVTRTLSATVWDYLVVPVLGAPLFLVLGVIGALLLLIGRRPAA